MTRLRRLGHLAVTASLVPFAAWTAVRLLGVEHGSPSMQLMSFTPYVALASLGPLAAAAATRKWWHAGVAGVLAVTLAACVLPRAWSEGGPHPTGPALRVVSSNLLLGQADARAVVALVRAQRADVLAVQELTRSAAANLDAAGLATLLPYRVVRALSGSGGSAVYSRFPLSDTGVRAFPSGHTQAYGTLAVPGARPVAVESAHPCAPSDDRTAREWAHEMTLEPPATPSGTPRVLVGDFNSTLDHGGLRRLVGTGYRDAAEVVGAGLSPTWPFEGRRVYGQRVPPVTIDHALADRRIGIGAVSVHQIPGSDHRALAAELTLPAR